MIEVFVILDEPLDHLIYECNTTLAEILNKHAPLKTKTVKTIHRQPWFNDCKRCEIILRCKKVNDWNNNPTVYRWNTFYQQRCFVSNLINSAKQNYYLDYINEQHFDIKVIFSMANKMPGKSSNTPIPDHEDLTDMTNGFNNLFVDKNSNIMRNLVPMESNPSDPKYIEDQYTTDMRYSSIKQVTTETITNIIGNAPSTSSELDLLPIGIVKEFTTVIFRNSRPVSIFSYSSKLIEHVVSQQLIEFTKESGMVESLQSAYRSQCSTEIALLKVKVYILHARDNQKVTSLIMLDLSGPFDTVSQSVT